jgi:hypothetical protein
MSQLPDKPRKQRAMPSLVCREVAGRSRIAGSPAPRAFSGRTCVQHRAVAPRMLSRGSSLFEEFRSRADTLL